MVRHAGYENIAEELAPAYGAGEYQAAEGRKKRIRRSLSDIGFNEAIGYSFIDKEHDGVVQEVPGLFADGGAVPFVELQDSVIEGAVRMRPTLLPGLLDSVRLNLNFQRRDIKLFEIGKVFSTIGEGGLPNERELFAVILTGGQIYEGRTMPVRELDFFDAKGAVETALDAVDATSVEFSAADVKHLRRGQSASIALGGTEIGYVGRLSEEIASNYKFRQPVYVAEIDLQAVLESNTSRPRYTPLPKYPAVARDVSFVVERGTSYESIRAAAVSANEDLLNSVEFVDVFEGKGLGEDERSLTVRFTYRSDERTLVEDEVNRAHDGVLTKLADELGVRQRN